MLLLLLLLLLLPRLLLPPLLRPTTHCPEGRCRYRQCCYSHTTALPPPRLSLHIEHPCYSNAPARPGPDHGPGPSPGHGLGLPTTTSRSCVAVAAPSPAAAVATTTRLNYPATPLCFPKQIPPYLCCYCYSCLCSDYYCYPTSPARKLQMVASSSTLTSARAHLAPRSRSNRLPATTDCIPATTSIQINQLFLERLPSSQPLRRSTIKIYRAPRPNSISK